VRQWVRAYDKLRMIETRKAGAVHKMCARRAQFPLFDQDEQLK
jgi:hypothetical protein